MAPYLMDADIHSEKKKKKKKKKKKQKKKQKKNKKKNKKQKTRAIKTHTNQRQRYTQLSPQKLLSS